MKLVIKSLFGLNSIYSRKYGVALLVDPLLGGLALIILYIFSDVFSKIFIDAQYLIDTFFYIASALLSIYFFQELVRAIYVGYIINNRSYQIINRAKNSCLYVSATGTELEKLDKCEIISLGKDWSISDITFNFNRQSKHGDYLAKQAFYTVCEIKLSRLLPHVLFDSKKAKGSQFKALYLKAQRLSFEGNFDDHFDSYCPKSYHVDTLSFITPEVLEAMISVSDCDIEIINDSLLIFAPLLPKKELNDFQNHCFGIYNALNDNINTYRDDRLSGQKRKTDVTLFSKVLLESPRRFYLAAFFFTTIILILVSMSIYNRKPGYILNQFGVLSFAFGMSAIHKIFKIYRRNNSLVKSLRFESSIKHELQKTKDQVNV